MVLNDKGASLNFVLQYQVSLQKTLHGSHASSSGKEAISSFQVKEQSNLY